jgi:hypothetical protein
MMEFTVSAKRLDAHGSTALCKEASITLDTDLAGGTEIRGSLLPLRSA